MLPRLEAGAVAHDSVAVVSENPNSSPEPSDPDASPAAAPDTLERLVAESPSIEVISSAWMLLMSAAAEKLGLTGGAAENAGDPDAAPFDPRESSHFDLDEARRLITALAGLTTASVEYLGPHAGRVS